MAKKGLKNWIGKNNYLFLVVEYRIVIIGHFSDYMKGLYALFSHRVKCSEPLPFALRSNASFSSSQAHHFILALLRCHCSTKLRNRNQSLGLALKKHLRVINNLDVFFSARFFILTTERRFLRKMTDKKHKENGLSETKIEQLSKQPIIESLVSKSEDGKWIIHKTIVTDIKPVSYFEKVLGNAK